MAYTAKDPCPPTAFSVPKRNTKLEVWRRRGVGKKTPKIPITCVCK